MNRNAQTVVTADGSVTLFLPDSDETYHSVHGAVQESLHVYIKEGLNKVINKEKTIAVLEIGFGTGLNALLTFLEADNNECEVNYTTIEKFPLSKLQYDSLNYGTVLNEEHRFNAILETDWNTSKKLSPYFTIQKCETDLLELKPESSVYDLIYFDAFAPRVQPELWTEEIFHKLYSALKPNGFLVTYCAKGEVRRNMKAAGFSVQKLDGPPGKREMTRAVR